MALMEYAGSSVRKQNSLMVFYYPLALGFSRILTWSPFARMQSYKDLKI